MKVAFKTFGCRLSRAEALDQEAGFLAAGHEVVDLNDARAEPDCIIVRGCSVTARAQRDSCKTLEHLRRRFPQAKVIPVGCMPGAVKPEAYTDNESAVPMATSRAYLKVQDGCSGKCTYCIVPHYRGAPVSVPFARVLARAEAFLAAGFRELVVTGCNLALYRSDGKGLAELLGALAELPSPGHRVRLSSLEPGVVGEEILAVMEEHANICRFIHLSVQSGSNAVLARMKRGYRAETVAEFCAAARKRLGKRLALGADVITGFPGETDADFRLTVELVRGFANLHIFPYSERPGTPAAVMAGAVPRKVRIERARELKALAQGWREEFARSLIGQEMEVCVERGGDHGWSAEYLPCVLDTPAPRRTLVKMIMK